MHWSFAGPMFHRAVIALRPEHEVDRAEDAESGPEVIQFDRLLHVENGEWYKHRERDDFLHDFQLRKRELGVADPVGRNLKQIFKQRDAPAD